MIPTRDVARMRAEQMAAKWLYLGNRASERGQTALAERHYARAQKWHDQMNRLLGHGDGIEDILLVGVKWRHHDPNP